MFWWTIDKGRKVHWGGVCRSEPSAYDKDSRRSEYFFGSMVLRPFKVPAAFFSYVCQVFRGVMDLTLGGV